MYHPSMQRLSHSQLPQSQSEPYVATPDSKFPTPFRIYKSSPSRATSKMDSLGELKSFHSLAPELRNIIYRLHFDATTKSIKINDQASAPKRRHSKALQYTHVTSDTFRDAVAIFFASPLIYNEARGLFFADYYRIKSISLRDRYSIYAFSRLAPAWNQGIHRIDLLARSRVKARLFLNPIKMALKSALRKTGEYDSVKISPSLGLSENSSSHTAHFLRASLTMAGDEMRLEIRCTPGTNIKIQFTGPVAKLDWSLIPLMKYHLQLDCWDRSASVEVQHVLGGLHKNARPSLGHADEENTMVKFVAEAEAELEEYLGRPKE